MKKKIISTGILCGGIVWGAMGLGVQGVSALTYSQDVPVSFTFNSSINVAVSSDLHIYNLAPGTSADSNIITVTTATNNVTGYTLTASVGDGTHSNPSYDNTMLNHENTSVTNSFTSLATTSDVAALGSLSDNTWGYSFSDDNGTSWTNYSGLPIYTAENWKELAATNANGTSEIKFKIGAKASADQPSGEYANVINFTAVGNAVAETEKSLDTATTLQEVTYCSDTLTVGQSYTLTDERDGNTYKVAKLADGKCWMLDNLALDPTSLTTVTNMSESNTNASAAAIQNYLNGGNVSGTAGWSSDAVADVDTGFDSYTAPMINNDSKDLVATSYGAGSGKVGIYYNYCAATAGTYCYEQGQGVDLPDTDIDAPYDICPAGWRMPTGGGSGEYYDLCSAYDSDCASNYYSELSATDTGSLQYNLSTPMSGYFYKNSAANQGLDGEGDWWSSTYSDGDDMGYFFVDSSYADPGYTNGRATGFSIRCVVGS